MRIPHTCRFQNKSYGNSSAHVLLVLGKNRSTGVDARTDKMVGLIGHQDDLTYQSRNYESKNFN